MDEEIKRLDKRNREFKQYQKELEDKLIKKEEQVKLLQKEKKNQEISSQFEADVFSNALGEMDSLQVARIHQKIQSTKNINLGSKTFNMLDSNMVHDGIEPDQTN